MGNEKFIVKIQVSVATNLSERQMLFYNQDRSVYGQGDLTEPVRVAMGESNKEFFYARLKDSLLVLDGKAAWQDW